MAKFYLGPMNQCANTLDSVNEKPRAYLKDPKRTKSALTIIFFGSQFRMWTGFNYHNWKILAVVPNN